MADARVIDSPYLTTKEAMAYLKITSASQFHKYIREHRLPTLHCGGRLRFDKRELDAWLRGTDHLTLVRAERQMRKRA